jgi:DNA-binding transcriptional LysR family regulator
VNCWKQTDFTVESPLTRLIRSSGRRASSHRRSERMEIDPRLLRNFLAVADELNFNRAAERVHLSQPSLSVAIRKLEEHCGFALFDRNVHGVALTDGGRRLVPVARDLLERSAAVGAFIDQLARGEPEIFRVGYSPFLDMPFVGSIQSGFRNELEAPVEFVSATTEVQVRGLLTGELHAGLLIPFPSEPAITVEVLRREPFFVALPHGHKLGRHSTVEISDIRPEPVIWFTRDVNSSFYDRFFTTCADAHYAPKVVQAVTTALECLQFVALGGGISFATRSLSLTGFKGICFRELGDDRFFIETAIAYRRDNRSEVLKRFVHFVRKDCEEHT